MLLHRNLYVLLLLLSLTGGCAGQSSKGQADKDPKASQAAQAFSLPKIPSVLVTPQERAEYLIAHYWENFSFRDTTLISRAEVTEQAFVDFVDMLPLVAQDRAQASLTSMMDSASVDSSMYAHFMSLTEKYLYNPNSPFRNEEYYIPVLQQIVASDLLSDIEKVRPAYQLEMAMKNRLGEVALDFAYTHTDGSRGRLSRLKGDYILLFFNAPDCADCQRVKEYIAASKPLVELTAKASPHPRLVILAVYPDEDRAMWKSTRYPACMLNTHDAEQAITLGQLYDLKAIPTLYLLDKEKRVLLKDAGIEQIEDYLMRSAK